MHRQVLTFWLLCAELLIKEVTLNQTTKAASEPKRKSWDTIIDMGAILALKPTGA